MSYGAVILAITLGFSGLGENKQLKWILQMMASTNLRTPMKLIDFILFLTSSILIESFSWINIWQFKLKLYISAMMTNPFFHSNVDKTYRTKWQE